MDTVGEFTPEEREFYAKHLSLSGFGENAQRRLAQARVAVIGLGGLGCPVVGQLAAAGVGFLRLVDHDSVAISNVLRQNLYTIADTGLPKADVATRRAQQLNPFIRAEAIANSFEPTMLEGMDLVVDATDNYETRVEIACAAREEGIPLVHGAAIGAKGRLAIFWPKSSPCAGCLMPDDAEGCGSCAEGGVLATVTSVIGSLMAHEAIKALSGLGEPLQSLLVFDGPGGSFAEFTMTPRADCELCGCSESVQTSGVPAVTVERLAQKIRAGEEFVLLDVREEHELDISRIDPCVHVPMAQVLWQSRDLPKDAEIFVLCRTGNRSGTITRALMLRGFTNVFNVAGGINAYAEQIDPRLTVY